MDKEILKKAAGPFVKEGVTKVDKGEIQIPLAYKGPQKISPMSYILHEMKESSEDHIPEYSGTCFLAGIYITAQICLPIAFKVCEEESIFFRILV